MLQEKFDRHVFTEEGQIFSVDVDCVDSDQGSSDVLRVDFEPCFARYLMIHQDMNESLVEGSHDVLCFEEWHQGVVVFRKTSSYVNNSFDYVYLWEECLKWLEKEQSRLKKEKKRLRKEKRRLRKEKRRHREEKIHHMKDTTLPSICHSMQATYLY